MPRETERPWFTLPPGEAYRAAWTAFDQLRVDQRPRMRERAADYLALYDPASIADSAAGFGTALSEFFEQAEMPSHNVIQAVTDTLVSQLVKNKVKPLFLTQGGDAKLRRQAEGMSQAVEGTFMEAGVYGDLGRDWAQDASVWGTGMLKAFPDYASQRVVIERVWHWDVFVSERDARTGRPREMAHIFPIPRAVLLERFATCDSDEDADKAHAERMREAIMRADAAPADYDSSLRNDMTDDMVLVCEFWHLPSGRVDLDESDVWDVEKCKHDGRHGLCIGPDDDQCLTFEAWPFEYTNLIRFIPKRKNMGWRGRGVPETLMGIQRTLNRMDKRIDQCMHLHGRPIIAVDRGAKINTSLLTNDTALIIEMSRQGGLQYIQPSSIPSEYISQRNELVQWGFEQFGLSQLSATGKVPANLESGAAINSVLNTESVRHADAFLGWEDAHIQLARVVVDSIRMLAENGDNFLAVWGDDAELKEIDWRDVDLPESKYRLRSWPTNLFSQTPAAKRDEVLELVRYGIFDPSMAMQALDFPDMKKLMGDRAAGLKNIERIVDRLVTTDEILIPHPYLDLPVAKTLCVSKLNELEAAGRVDAPESERLRKYIEQIDRLMQPPPPPPGMMPGPPPGPPGPAGVAGPPAPAAAPMPPGPPPAQEAA